jgi:hypothetical protein
MSATSFDECIHWRPKFGHTHVPDVLQDTIIKSHVNGVNCTINILYSLVIYNRRCEFLTLVKMLLTVLWVVICKWRNIMPPSMALKTQSICSSKDRYLQVRNTTIHIFTIFCKITCFLKLRVWFEFHIKLFFYSCSIIYQISQKLGLQSSDSNSISVLFWLLRCWPCTYCKDRIVKYIWHN